MHAAPKEDLSLVEETLAGSQLAFQLLVERYQARMFALIRRYTRNPVEGYVVALCHDPAALTLDAIAVGAAAVAQGADFSQSEIFAGGGTLGVVIDLVATLARTVTVCLRTAPAAGSRNVTEGG